VEGEIAGEVTRIRTDMQEFVNKQLPGWIQEGVSSGLRNLPPPPPTLTIEQIREVVRSEQPRANPFDEQVERERTRQKEKEIFEQWMKEFTQEAEKAMEKKMAEQNEQLKGFAKKSNPRREEEGNNKTPREERLSRWASQIPPNLPELPPSPSPVLELSQQAPPPPSPPPRC
jgi:hypothetical protein